jgi:hypothetical protein
VAAAREQALQGAFIARTRTDIDARDDELRRQFRYDPEGYERAAGEMVSGFIQGSPSEFAVDVETYARSRAQNGLSVVANARAARDEQETAQALGVRRAQLQERMIAMAAQPEGIAGNVDYLATSLEYNALQDEAEGNPAVLYSPEQRAADDETLTVGVQNAIVGVQAVQTYTASGGGLPGIAAAQRQLREDILDSDTFAALKPEVRARLYRDATAQLNQYATADREAARVQAEEERQRVAAARDRRDTYSLRIAMGDTVSADELRNDPLLDDGDRAQLVRASDAAARREAAQARTDAALEAQASRETYAGYRDQAAAGTLSPAELADAVSAGLISRGQARTLNGLSDRSLQPVVADIMAPVRDAMNAPGRSQRGQASQLAIAEQAALEYARTHPDASLQDRLTAGRVISERVMGTRGAGRPAAAGGAASPQAAQTNALSALSAERARRASSGNRMSAAEYNRRRNEIIHGN